MNLPKVKAVAMFVVCGLMMIMGAYLTVFEGVLHEVGGDKETHAELSIMHLGHIEGNQRLIIMAFGMLLIFMAAKFMWKIDVVQTFKKHANNVSKLTHYVTESGKEIARRMRSKDLS
jgi:hypothetical protein